MGWVVKRKWSGGEVVVGVFGNKVEAKRFAKAEQEVVEKYFKEAEQKFVVEKNEVGK